MTLLKPYILTVTAQDRPGIVAGVSEAVFELQGNIDAVSQTVHQGYFTMILTCSFPTELDNTAAAELIRQRVGDDLHVYITAYRPGHADTAPKSKSFILTQIGPDRPGILRSLTGYLASRGININDLYSCVTDGNFVTICQVSVPASVDIRMVQADFEAAGKEGNYTVHLQHENIFAAINDLAFGYAR